MTLVNGRPDGVETAIRHFVQRLRERMQVTAVLLFGSRARGDWLRDSDVDLLVLSPDLDGVPHLARLERLFAEWAAVSRLPADVLGLTPDEFAARADELSVIGEIARKGVVLYQEAGWRRPPVQAPR
jgi:predicted nucleotidyltransferase